MGNSFAKYIDISRMLAAGVFWADIYTMVLDSEHGSTNEFVPWWCVYFFLLFIIFALVILF